MQYRDGFARCSECDVALVATLPVGEEVVPGPEWVEVAGYTTEDEAWLAHGLLAEKGIKAFVVNRQVVLNPFPASDTAEVLLLVAPEDVERADAELARAEAGEDEISEEDIAADEGSEPQK
jgi:hypothetical protein